MKSFPRQSRSRGGGIATVYKSTLGSSITFRTNFDFTHTSFEVVQASITLLTYLKMFTVAQALTSLMHDCIERSSSDILSGGADICNYKLSANE